MKKKRDLTDNIENENITILSCEKIGEGVYRISGEITIQFRDRDFIGSFDNIIVEE